jgi:hypothetical protein
MGDLIRLAPRRPTAQERFRDTNARLIGAELRWKRYRSWNAAWLPGRCELCRMPFSDDGSRGSLHSGYAVVHGGPAGQDDYIWICAVCVESRGHWFGWTMGGSSEAVPGGPRADSFLGRRPEAD